MKADGKSNKSFWTKLLLGAYVLTNFAFPSQIHKIKNRDYSTNDINLKSDTTQVMKFKNRNKSTNKYVASFQYAKDLVFKNRGKSTNNYTINLKGDVSNLEINGINTNIIHRYSQEQLNNLRKEVSESEGLLKDYVDNEIQKTESYLEKMIQENEDLLYKSANDMKKYYTNLIDICVSGIKRNYLSLKREVEDNEGHIRVLYTLSEDNNNELKRGLANLKGIYSADTTRTNSRVNELTERVGDLEEIANSKKPKTELFLGAGTSFPLNNNQNISPHMGAEIIYSPSNPFSLGASVSVNPFGKMVSGNKARSSKDTKYLGGGITKETVTNTTESLNSRSYLRFSALAQANLDKWQIGYSYGISPEKSERTTDEEKIITYTSNGIPYKKSMISNQEIGNSRGLRDSHKVYVGRDIGRKLNAQVGATKSGKHYGLNAGISYKVPLNKKGGNKR